MNKLLLFSPFFGTKIPSLARLVIQSWGENPQLDFVVHTDCPEEFSRIGVERYSNIHLVVVSYEEYLSSYERSLGISLDKIRARPPVSLCRLRPAAGECFAELIRGYLFWGYIDIDVILGRVADFVTEEILGNYDIFPFTQIIRGNLILLKNNPKLTTAWRKVPRAADWLNDPRHTPFDEHPQMFPKVLYESSDIKIFPHTRATNWTVDFRWYEFAHLREMFWSENLSEVIYKNGRVFDKSAEQEFAGVVLDAFSKWSQAHDFSFDSEDIVFLNPKVNPYRRQVVDIEDPSIFYRSLGSD